MQPSIKTRSSQSFGKEVLEVFSEDLHVGVYHQFLCKTMSAFFSPLCTQHWSCHFGMIQRRYRKFEKKHLTTSTPLPGWFSDAGIFCHFQAFAGWWVFFTNPKNRKIGAGSVKLFKSSPQKSGGKWKNNMLSCNHHLPSFPGARDLLVQTACQYSQASSLTVAAA